MKKIFCKEQIINDLTYLLKDNPKLLEYLPEKNIRIETLLKQPGISLYSKLKLIRSNLTQGFENFEFAIGLAEIVLPSFEREFPSDCRPREAIMISRKFVEGRYARLELQKATTELNAIKSKILLVPSFEEYKVILSSLFFLEFDQIIVEQISNIYENLLALNQLSLKKSQDYYNLCNIIVDQFPSNYDLSCVIEKAHQSSLSISNKCQKSAYSAARAIYLASKLATSDYAESRVVSEEWKNRRKKFIFLDQDSCEEFPEINREKWASMNTSTIIRIIVELSLLEDYNDRFNEFLLDFCNTH